MKKILFLAFFMLFFFLKDAVAMFRLVGAIDSANIRQIAISPFDNNEIFVISNNTFYRTKGDGFVKMHGAVSGDMCKLLVDKDLDGVVYLATIRNLYRVTDKISKVFTMPEDAKIYDIAKAKGQLYVATSLGVYHCSEDFFNFTKIAGLDGHRVYSIAANKEFVILSADTGLYKITGNNDVNRVFVDRNEDESDDESFEMRVVYVDAKGGQRVLAGMSNGLLLSLDEGESWRKVNVEGLNGVKIKCIARSLFEKDIFYLATGKGFFRVDMRRFSAKQLFEGLPTNTINWVSLSADGKIYLATARGVFVNEYFTASKTRNEITRLCAEEVPISQVQQAALRYNEVDPSKIRAWRKRLKIRGLLPTVSLDYDKTITYDSGVDKFYVGPKDWGVSASWNLGELVWNAYEDDIDTRSRLDTQLRIDILDEVNRIYYERVRLKYEIMNGDFSGEELFLKKLRLEELSSVLDGYTGGFFSSRREKN